MMDPKMKAFLADVRKAATKRRAAIAASRTDMGLEPPSVADLLSRATGLLSPDAPSRDALVDAASLIVLAVLSAES